MIGRASSILGLAIADGRLLCGEVAARGGALRKQAVFAPPGGFTLDRPEEMGTALREFLKHERFTATAAVVGIPARWVIAQEREVPPATPAEAAALLRLQAERLAASDASDIAFDFVGQPRSDAATRVLVVGTLRSRLTQLERMLTAAGLQLRAVTPTGLAVASSLGEGAGDAPVLLLQGTGADVVWRTGGTPRLLQHVPLSLNGHGKSLSMLGLELRRGLIRPAPGAEREAVVLNASSFAMEELGDFFRSAGITARPHPSTTVGHGADTAAAVAVASAAAAHALPADFLHSRLAAPTRRGIGRRTWWAAAVGLIVVALAGFELIDYQMQLGELQALESHTAAIAPDVAQAEAAIARTGFGRGFYEGRPPVLDCLREVTLAFGEDPKVWATGVSFRAGAKGQLTGAATDQQAALALLERIKANGHFDDVTLIDLRDAAAAREREVGFTITFVYRPEGQP